MWINMDNLQIVHTYLFGGVKFLDLLAVLMGIDIATGVFRAFKEKRLHSRSAWWGYARKLGVFLMVIVANVIDVILSLQGTVAFATVLFYIANEGLSIAENLSQVGVKVPTIIKDKLQVIQEEDEEKKEKGEDEQ